MLPLLLALTLTSPDVRNAAPVPKALVWNRDGCTGQNIPPRLRWSDVPRGTLSFAITVVDYDVKPNGWVHWLVYNLPTYARAMDPSVHYVAGRNDFGTLGWGGPCPPPGPPHHYTLQLDALGIVTNFGSATTLAQYRARVKGHVLASARIVPVYGR